MKAKLTMLNGDAGGTVEVERGSLKITLNNGQRWSICVADDDSLRVIGPCEPFSDLVIIPQQREVKLSLVERT